MKVFLLVKVSFRWSGACYMVSFNVTNEKNSPFNNILRKKIAHLTMH